VTSWISVAGVAGAHMTASPRRENGDGTLNPQHKIARDQDGVVDEQHGQWVREGSDVEPHATSQASELHATALMLWQAGADLQDRRRSSFEDEECEAMAAADASGRDDASPRSFLSNFSDSYTMPSGFYDDLYGTRPP
jgi:hypothetical protein